MLKRLLLLVFIACLFACSHPKSLVPESPFDPQVTHYVHRLDGKRKKTKHLQGLETAFQQAQIMDLALIDSLLEENRPELWPTVNMLHRRLQTRQEKVAALEPLQAKNGYAPTLHFVTDIAGRESESRRNAATYLYARAEKLLSESVETNNPAAAREAFYTLQDLKQNYYRYWENANTLYDEAKKMGVTHILLTNLPAADSVAGREFWRDVLARARYSNDDWHIYHPANLPDQRYDYVVECRVETIEIGPESRSESSYTEEKDIEVGQEEKRDTAGHVVERVPIYRHVSATVTQISVSRQARGTLSVVVRNIHTDSLLFSQILSGRYNYDENASYYSGDSEALSSPVTSTSANPSAPSEMGMSDHLMDDLQSELFRFLKKNLAAF